MLDYCQIVLECVGLLMKICWILFGFVRMLQCVGMSLGRVGIVGISLDFAGIMWESFGISCVQLGLCWYMLKCVGIVLNNVGFSIGLLCICMACCWRFWDVVALC